MKIPIDDAAYIRRQLAWGSIDGWRDCERLYGLSIADVIADGAEPAPGLVHTYCVVRRGHKIAEAAHAERRY